MTMIRRPRYEHTMPGTALEQWSVGTLAVGGTQVIGAQSAAVADPVGGGVVDTECRAQLVALLGKLRTHGLIAT